MAQAGLMMTMSGRHHDEIVKHRRGISEESRTARRLCKQLGRGDVDSQSSA
jgi:hypothetical protein